MKALTLHPEWVWAILFLSKRIENRSWHPGSKFIGQRFAIHAGKCIGGETNKYYQWEALLRMAHTAAMAGWEYEADALKKRIAFWKEGDRAVHDLHMASLATSGAMATAELDKVVQGEQGRQASWGADGLVHWYLKGVKVLGTKVPCGGMQRLWTLKDDVEKAVINQLI